MSAGTSDQYLDREDTNEIQDIANSILARHGVDPAAVQRAGGWTNTVWLSDGLVLRLSTCKGNPGLLREAQLAWLFPPGVGYPELVECGTTAGFAWTLAARLSGQSLGNAWAALNQERRVTALRGLWERAQAVHSVPAGEAAGIVSRESWFNSTDPERAEAGLARLAKDRILTEHECKALQDTLARFWKVKPAAPQVLCHGDLTLDNAIWHAEGVTALLDFEFAVMAPIQLDLNHLVKCAYSPEGAEGPGEGEQALRQAVKAIARPLLAQAQEKALLAGYAVLLELWLLTDWLDHPQGEGPLEQWEPLRRLRSLADGKLGYLGAIIRGDVSMAGKS